MKSILRRFGRFPNSPQPKCATTECRLPSHSHRALRVEPLEDRRLLAVIAVDSLADGPVNLTDGNMTLRDALALAADAAYPGADEIIFADSLGLDTSPGEIELLNGELLIDSDVTITGPGASNLAIDADADDDGTGESRVFYVNAGVAATLHGVAVTHGNTTSRGGGICNEGGVLTVTASHIANNYGKYGGGIHNSGTLNVVNSTISGNSGTSGGGIRNWSGTTTVTNSTIANNRVLGLGGGVVNSATLAIANSTISGNSSASDGGGIWNDPGTATVTNARIFGNTANVSGGGVFSSAGTMSFANTAISGNQAYAGGGVYCYSSTMELTNSTIAANVAGVRGGGVYSQAATMTLANSIAALNSAPNSPDVDGAIGGSYNLLGDGTGMTGMTDGTDGNQVGTSAAPIDPAFVRDPSSGADAIWGTADDDYGDVHLLPASLAIDAGHNSLAVAALGPEDFGEILIDHNDVDITALTQAEMQAAKDSLHIGYAHTSHGSQVTTGMTGLVAFANGGGKGLALPANFFTYNNGGSGGALDLHDYCCAGDVGYYPQWVNETRDYLDNPANADVNVMMWSWCGQVDDKWAAGTLDSQYIEPMTQLELDYPNVHFVYMTGHVDHWDDADNKAANQHIRDYCADNDKILYDFADIESYDPDGAFYEFPHDNCDYYASASGAKLGNWATAWQATHTQGVDWYSCSSAHSEPLNANQKAYAAWALFSEIAALPDLPPMTDLDGNARVVDGDLDEVATVDMGAYEFHVLS